MAVLTEVKMETGFLRGGLGGGSLRRRVRFYGRLLWSGRFFGRGSGCFTGALRRGGGLCSGCRWNALSAAPRKEAQDHSQYKGQTYDLFHFSTLLL